jgi:peptidoglycan-N-acetylglucosamine deacetylase
MWIAGVGWSARGFECAIVDRLGVSVGQRTRFTADRQSDLITFLRDAAERSAGELVVVVDSTNGLLDGSLMAAGLVVYRADPPALPARPAFGSVDAEALARVDPARLTRLSIPTGTIAGRGEESAAAIEASAGVEHRLAAEGRFAAHGTRGRAEVALTFDDCPDPRFTGSILDILRDHGAPATFFCVGMKAGAHPHLVARAADEGHAVGNHTWSHPYLPDLTRDEVLRQVDATNQALTTATGAAPTLVRPPYGARTPQALRWLAAHGMTTVVWDVDTGDWARPGTAAIAAAAAAVQPGSVLLMHDGGGDRSQTVAALPAILTRLSTVGYEFVSLDRMLRPGD